MDKISRRQFLYISAFLPLSYHLSIVVASPGENKLDANYLFPITIAILKSAYLSEKLASEHYVGYSRKAVQEKYHNIAYLFSALEVSEKIHAENYKKILTSLSAEPEELEFEILILDTKANLMKASDNELLKIQKTYPDFLDKLKQESCEEAIVKCTYSWKSHQQHLSQLNEIRKYSPQFFGSVAKKIEEMKLDFHVCEICGSTINEVPKTPCEICNNPKSLYQRVKRPA